MTGRSRRRPGPVPVAQIVVNPIPNGGQRPPTPTIVGNVPGDPAPIPAVQSPQQRIGYLDRPYRLLAPPLMSKEPPRMRAPESSAGNERGRGVRGPDRVEDREHLYWQRF